jgi:hypothetical protein
LIRALALFPISLMLNKRTFGLSPLSYLKSIAPSVYCGLVAFIVLSGFAWAGIFKSGNYLYLKITGEAAICLVVYAGMLRIVSKSVYKELWSVFNEIRKRSGCL